MLSCLLMGGDLPRETNQRISRRWVRRFPQCAVRQRSRLMAREEEVGKIAKNRYCEYSDILRSVELDKGGAGSLHFPNWRINGSALSELANEERGEVATRRRVDFIFFGLEESIE